MNIRLRFLVLLSTLIALFVLLFFFKEQDDKQRIRDYREEETYQRKALCENLLTLNARALDLLVKDYALWDEMVAFVSSRDPAWAQLYLSEATMDMHQVQAFWVYDLQGNLIYMHGHAGVRKIQAFAMLPQDMHRIFGGTPFAHFFVRMGDDVLEVRGSRIHPGDDDARQGPGAGYLFAGKFWDAAYLHDLAGLIGEQTYVTLSPSAAAAGETQRRPEIMFDKPLLGWDQKPVAYLRIVARTHDLQLFYASMRRDAVVLSGALLFLCGVIFSSILWWVIRPLRLVTSALSTGDMRPLRGLVNRTNEFGGIARLMRDFFQQKKVLQKSEQHYRLLMDNMRDVVFRLSFDGVIEYVSASAAVQFGYNINDLIGQPFSHVVVQGEERKALEAINKIVRGEDVKFVELLMRDSAGKIIPSEVYASPVRESGKIVAVQGAIRDITERKKSEERDKAYINEIQSINRDLDNYSFIISHDLQEPLRSIDAFARFLESDCAGTLNGQAKEYLSRIRANSVRMQELIEDLLKISRIERTDNALEEVEIRDIIAEINLRLDYAIARKCSRIDVVTQLPRIVCDRVRLTQVFQNLVSNALKFNDKPEPRVEIGAVQRLGAWEFFVRDNGPGIEERYFEKIFEIFQRLHKRENNEGTGAGLTIVKKIVEMHQGRVWVTSRVGEGSVFYFTIPQAALQERGGSLAAAGVDKGQGAAHAA